MWQLPVALAPNFASLVVGRALVRLRHSSPHISSPTGIANTGKGGLSSAGGSVTLGMVADLWHSDEQQYPLAFVVLSSVGGTSVGPVVGAPIAAFLSWRWNIWVQLIFGVTVQAIHFFMPECRSTILMDREAKRRRKTGEDPDIVSSLLDTILCNLRHLLIKPNKLVVGP